MATNRVRDPERNVPRAIIAGVAGVAVLYLAATLAVQGTVPQARLAESGAPFADAAQAIFGGAWAAKAIAAVALISALGSLNGFNLVNSEMAAGAARDGLFPRPLCRRVRGLPVPALLLNAILATALIAFNAAGDLLAALHHARAVEHLRLRLRLRPLRGRRTLPLARPAQPRRPTDGHIGDRRDRPRHGVLAVDGGRDGRRGRAARHRADPDRHPDLRDHSKDEPQPGGTGRRNEKAVGALTTPGWWIAGSTPSENEALIGISRRGQHAFGCTAEPRIGRGLAQLVRLRLRMAQPETDNSQARGDRSGAQRLVPVRRPAARSKVRLPPKGITAPANSTR